jgi:hypothetical protein
MTFFNVLHQTLGSLPSPLYKENRTDLLVTIFVKANSIPVNISTLETILQFSPRLIADDDSGFKSFKKIYTPTVLTTGVYQITIPALDFNQPGTYSILSRGISTTVLDAQLLTVRSDDFLVLDKGQSDSFNTFTDTNQTDLEITIPEQITVINTQIDNIVSNSTGFTITENSLSTTDASVTIALTTAIANNSMMFLKYWVQALRTGGSAGSVGDSSSFERTLKVINVGGVLTIKFRQSDFTSQDQDWNIDFLTSGTNLILTVQGTINNNINWKVTSWNQSIM